MRSARPRGIANCCLVTVKKPGAQITLLIVRRSSLVSIPAERPAHAKGSVKTIRAIGAKVRRAEGFAISPEPIHLMLRRAQFEVLRQLKTDSNRTIVSNRCHGGGVGELGDVPPKAEFGFEK